MSIRPWHSIARKRQREGELSYTAHGRHKKKISLPFPIDLLCCVRLYSNDSRAQPMRIGYECITPERNAIIVQFPFGFSVPAAPTCPSFSLTGRTSCVCLDDLRYRVCNQKISRIDMRHEDAIIYQKISQGNLVTSLGFSCTFFFPTPSKIVGGRGKKKINPTFVRRRTCDT